MSWSWCHQPAGDSIFAYIGLDAFACTQILSIAPQTGRNLGCLGAVLVDGVGQVRINNRSFEVSEGLPTATGQFGLLDSWGNAGSLSASPDFYHIEGQGAGDLPQTPLAKVNPFEGDAVAGFIAYTEEAVSRHEYIVGSFSNPLEVGQEYRMTFMLTSGRVHDWVNAGLGVSGLGIHCSLTPPNQQGYERLLLPTQFTIEEAFYDKQWREVAFVFRAEEPFRHFTFGLFEGEPSVRREETGARDMAYYFVDRFTIGPYMPELALEGDQGVQPRPEETELEGLFIPNAFTPDGDALNVEWQWSMPEGLTADLRTSTDWACCLVRPNGVFRRPWLDRHLAERRNV